MNDKIELILRTRTTLHDGTPVYDSPFHIATEICYAEKDDVICFDTNEYIFAVGTYSDERELKYKEEYCYLPESMWLSYNQDLHPMDYSNQKYRFKKSCYYKLCIKRIDEKEMRESDIRNIKQLIDFSPEFRGFPKGKYDGIKSCFVEEAKNTIYSYSELFSREDDSLSVILLADTHNVLNGTWFDTQKNIEYISKRISLDAIIHLGDFTDGIASKKKTLRYANEVIDGLSENSVPLYITIGNHDTNYFRNNKEYMTISEQAEVYLDREVPYYYKDVKGIRLVFLYAYDNDNKVRYGFLDEEIKWLEKLLMDTDKEQKIIIFSHDAPLAKLDYWSDKIYNGTKLVDLLEQDNKDNDNRILAFIHGHTHADFIYRKLSFPIVSIGCNKCEDFKEHTPEGFVKWDRKFDDVTQDLWDILVYNKTADKMDLIRFGAGEDRRVR